MSDTSPSNERAPRTDSPRVRTTDSGDDTSLETLLSVLNDENARAILEAVADGQKSATELADSCGLSLSTTYRKLDGLTEAGLLDEQLDVHSSGNNVSRYSLRLDTVHLSLTDDQFELQVDHGT